MSETQDERTGEEWDAANEARARANDLTAQAQEAVAEAERLEHEAGGTVAYEVPAVGEPAPAPAEEDEDQ